jgi:hypothetical protein
MNTFSELIHQTGLDSVILANTASSSIHANWMENVVFSLMFILGSACLLRGAWNGLLTEFPRIGRMSYFRAVHMVAVFGVVLSILWFIFL